jgi:hypothetical protein
MKKIIRCSDGSGNSGGDFTSKTSGRLFLFVNDALWFYGNNRGKATVTVTQVN